MFPIRASPDPGGLVPAAGSDQLAIRRKGHGNDSRGVGLKREEFFAGPGIIHVRNSVITAGSNALAVRRKRHTIDLRAIPWQCEQFLSPRLPYLYRAVPAPGGDPFAIW